MADRDIFETHIQLKIILYRMLCLMIMSSLTAWDKQRLANSINSVRTYNDTTTAKRCQKVKENRKMAFYKDKAAGNE
jgi:hypothetical protein